MEKVTQIASFLFDRYKKQYEEIMDEIKLQKLLYFIQREAIIRTGELMFDAEFRAWKYGPVILEIHDRYKSNDLKEILHKKVRFIGKNVLTIFLLSLPLKRL